MSYRQLVLIGCLVSTPAAFAGMGHDKAAASKQTIIQTAQAAGSFKTLLAAIDAAGLTSTLNGAGPFTVFAPTDEAFAKLPPGTVEALLKDKAKLTAILTYHVVSGKVMAAELVKMPNAKTLQGGSLAVSTSSGVKVDNASVVKADIGTSNGVIHVIDTVVLPPA